LYQPGLAADGKTRIAVNPLNPAQTLPVAAIGASSPARATCWNGIRLAGHGINKYLMEYRGLAPAPRSASLRRKRSRIWWSAAASVSSTTAPSTDFRRDHNPPTTFQPTLINDW